MGSCVCLGELCNLSVNGTLSRAGWASLVVPAVRGCHWGLLLSQAVARVGVEMLGPGEMQKTAGEMPPQALFHYLV